MAEENNKEVYDLDVENAAIDLVKSEWRAWENQIVYVTDKVGFNIRNLVKTLRKNFWGIFDNDVDPVSGKKLTWVPLTEWVCDTWVKNADIDSKDLNVRAKKGSAIGLTALIRQIIRNWMDDNIFGEELDETERQMAIDGSHIWKTFEGIDEETGKKTMIREDVDILNAYFDMSAKSIQKAYRFTERALLTASEIKEMDGWMNTEGLETTSNLHPTDTNLSTATSTKDNVKYRDVWELWGRIPLYLITGKKKDTKEVFGHIVVSGLQGKTGNARVHLIETNPGGKKPYEEAHTKKIKGRWLAKGPAEQVMMLQSWLNMIVNIRKLRHQVSQLGIFKMRKGSQVAPQNLSRMAANGVILVEKMEDLEQFTMNEMSQSSYSDENVAVGWAQRITSSFEAVTGEQMPASQPATNTVIQAKASNSQFIMFKKQIGFFLERWLKRHGLPILTKLLTYEEVIQITGSLDELEAYDEAIINCLAYQQLEKGIKKEGKFFDPAQVEQELTKIKNKLRKTGKDRFVKLLDKVDFTKYDVKVYVTNEEIDTGVLTNNLISVLKLVPQYQDAVIRYLFDLMGLDTFQLEEAKRKMINQGQNPNMPQQQMPGQPASQTQNEQKLVTNANIPV